MRCPPPLRELLPSRIASNGTNPNGTWTSLFPGRRWWRYRNYHQLEPELDFGPTLARMSGGSAIVDDDGLVELKWQTGLEVDNLGFNIYREEGGQRTRVNKHIIAGSALIAGQGTAMTAGRNYRWRDTTAKPGQAAQYWVEAKDLNGSTLLSGPFSPTYSPGRLDAQPPSATLAMWVALELPVPAKAVYRVHSCKPPRRVKQRSRSA